MLKFFNYKKIKIQNAAFLGVRKMLGMTFNYLMLCVRVKGHGYGFG